MIWLQFVDGRSGEVLFECHAAAAPRVAEGVLLPDGRSFTVVGVVWELGRALGVDAVQLVVQ